MQDLVSDLDLTPQEYFNKQRFSDFKNFKKDKQVNSLIHNYLKVEQQDYSNTQTFK